MKRIYLSIISIFICFTTYAQSNSSAILGDWYNQEKDAIINIYEEEGKYFGKITWMLNPLDENGKAKTDPLNPDENSALDQEWEWS